MTTNPFLGLGQGYEMYQNLRYGPELRQLDMMQKRAQLQRSLGLDPVSQQNIAASKANINLSQQQEKRLQSAQDREKKIIDIKMRGRLAKMVLDSPPEERESMMDYFGNLYNEPIPPEQRTEEALTQVWKASQAMVDPRFEKLSLDRERLLFQKQQAASDVEQKRLDRLIKEKELQIKNMAEQRQSKKMSAASESNLIKSQDSAIQNQETANQFGVLIDDYSRLDPQSGLVGSFDEFLASTLGTQDEVNDLRRRFNKVRLGEGLKSLPPGPATDKDVEMALKGVPPANASTQQVQSFLRGARRLALFNAGYDQFKSDFISENGNTRGLLSAWRKPVYSSVLKEDVSLMEIYEESLDRGLTVEKVKSDLGIK